MRVSSVSYGFTKNLGNFQSQRVDATVELTVGDDFDEGLNLAVSIVMEALGEALVPAQYKLLEQERKRAKEAVFIQQEALRCREAQGGGTQ